MSISIEVTGIQEAEDFFTHASDTLVSSVSMKLSQVLQEMANYARSTAPVKTGDYANSIHVEQPSELQFSLVADDRKAAWIEFGTSPHIITPGFSAATIKSKAGTLFARKRMGSSVLRFEVGGEVVFATYVMHPGTAPQLIIHNAKKVFIPQLVEVIRQGVAEALGGR